MGDRRWKDPASVASEPSAFRRKAASSQVFVQTPPEEPCQEDLKDWSRQQRGPIPFRTAGSGVRAHPDIAQELSYLPQDGRKDHLQHHGAKQSHNEIAP